MSRLRRALGAALSGTGTAHAYTDNERNYLFQLGPDMLQVPGSDGDKLQNGYWSATTCGAAANR
jgi:hypothetical protein